jgi:hypothetical protein
MLIFQFLVLGKLSRIDGHVMRKASSESFMQPTAIILLLAQMSLLMMNGTRDFHGMLSA